MPTLRHAVSPVPIEEMSADDLRALGTHEQTWALNEIGGTWNAIRVATDHYLTVECDADIALLYAVTTDERKAHQAALKTARMELKKIAIRVKVLTKHQSSLQTLLRATP